MNLPPFIGVRRLRLAVLALGLGTFSAVAARDSAIDSDDRDYLRRQHAWFGSLPAERQQQLRTLNEEFHQLDAESQTRLIRVMQNYNSWLAKLPDEERRAVTQAASSAERLRIIRDLRERDWVRTLPKARRDEYAGLTPENRGARVRDWRAEEDARHDEWSITQRNWEDLKLGKVQAAFTAEARQALDAFVFNLRSALSDPERKSLDDARIIAEENGQYMWYAIEVVRLADAHPLIPGKVHAKDLASLSEANRDYLIKNDRSLVRKKGQPGFASEENRELRKAAGHWPEFSLELARHAERHSLKLPEPLGDCEKAKMPAEVQAFLEKVLEPALRKTDKGREQLDALQRASGKWPEYPKMIMELARINRLPIPGWTLPGAPQNWDRFRAAKIKKR